MMPIARGELLGMRDTLESVFTTPVEVWRRTSTVDPGGGEIDTWSKVHDYKCLFYGNAGVERQNQIGIIQTITDFTLYFKVDADIHQQDHLKINNRTFNVERVGGATDEIQIGLLVGATELT